MRANSIRIALAAAVVLGSTPAARADFPPGGTLVSTSDATLGHTHVRLFRDPTGDVLVVWRLHGLAGSSCAAQRITPEGANAPGWPDSGVALSAPSYFDAAPDGAGGALAAYVTSGYDVLLERALGDGSRLPASGPGWPVADTSQTEWYPAVAGDGAGGAYVAWVRGLRRVYLKRVLSDGSPAPGWPATGVTIFAGDSFFLQAVALASPALMPDGAGGTYVMWLSEAGLMPGGARVLRVGGDGAVAPGWPAAGLSLGSGAPELYASPLLQLLPSGAEHVLAAWVDRPAGGDSTRLFLQRFHRSCVIDPAWPASGRHVVTAGQITGNFTLVPDAQDGVTALWEEKSLPRMIHVRADGTLPVGYAAGGLSPLDANAEYAPGSLHATIGPDGGVIVSWSDTRPSRPGIRVRWFLGDGTPGPGEPDTARVATPEGVPATNRGLLADGAGGVFVAWQDDTQAASSSYLLRLSQTPAFTTPTLVSLVRTEATIERVILRWYTAESGFTASVERRAEGEGWTAIGSVGPEGGGLLVFEDRDVAAGARYDYRLAVVAAGGLEYLGQVRVEVPSRYLLAFLGVRPNPGLGRLAIWFSLATREPARLEVLDVAGRRVLTRDLADLAPGNHALDLGESERLAAGVYLVRIAQGGQRAAGKAAIVR